MGSWQFENFEEKGGILIWRWDFSWDWAGEWWVADDEGVDWFWDCSNWLRRWVGTVIFKSEETPMISFPIWNSSFFWCIKVYTEKNGSQPLEITLISTILFSSYLVLLLSSTCVCELLWSGYSFVGLVQGKKWWWLDACRDKTKRTWTSGVKRTEFQIWIRN